MTVKDFSRNINHQMHVISVIQDLLHKIRDNITAGGRGEYPNPDRGLFAHKIDEAVAEDVIAWGAANDIAIARVDVGNFFVSF